jgi:glycosyltransferase involved in cell wall biosynthesis
MPDHPTIAICLLTYNRMETAEPVLRAMLDLIQYSEPFHVHVADDGSPSGYREKLVEIAGGYANVHKVTVSNSQRRGYGASYNLAAQAIDSNYAALEIEDDWLLARPLDLEPLVQAMVDGEAGCIRLGYLSQTASLFGEVRDSAAGKLLALSPNSPEHHVFTGHARLETTAWRQRLGPWPEGLRAGETEFEVCKRRESRIGVVWPLDVVMPKGDLFLHSGERSYNQLEPEGAEA